MLTITFTNEDFNIHDPDQDDAMVVITTTVKWKVHKILIEQESSKSVLYSSTFQKLNILTSRVKSYSDPLIGFARGRIHT